MNCKETELTSDLESPGFNLALTAEFWVRKANRFPWLSRGGGPQDVLLCYIKELLVLVATVAHSFQGSSRTAQGQKSSKRLYLQYEDLFLLVLLCGIWLCIVLRKVDVIPFNHNFSFLLFVSENASKKELWRENKDYQDSGECVKKKKKEVVPKKYC